MSWSETPEWDKNRDPESDPELVDSQTDPELDEDGYLPYKPPWETSGYVSSYAGHGLPRQGNPSVTDDEPKGPFKVVGSMRLSLAKSFGILFAFGTAFYVCYFIWSFFYDPTTIFQLIQRGSSILVFAYITYAIHSDIRSRVRYECDAGLYHQVGQLMADDPQVKKTLDQFRPDEFRIDVPEAKGKPEQGNSKA